MKYKITRHRGRQVVDYSTAAGRRRHVLSATDEATANAEAGKWIAALEREAERASATTVGDVIEIYWRKLPNATSNAMFLQWRKARATFNAMQPGDVDQAAIDAYVKARTQAGIKINTVRKELSILQAALRHAYKQGLVREVPRFVIPPAPDPRRVNFTKRDFDLLARQGPPHFRLFCTIAWYTGARSGAILALRWDQVDLEARLIHPASTGPKRMPTMPISQTLLLALREAYEAREGVRVVSYRGKGVSRIRRAFREACAAAGIKATPHSLRHGAARHMVEQGVPIAAVAQFLGHTTSRVTERVYARYGQQYLRDAAQALERDGKYQT